MDTLVNNAKLFAKIAKVMGQVRQLEKSGKNTYDKYEFMTADTVAHRIGSALASEGVAFFPSIVSVETSEYTTAKGAANFRSVVTMQLTFACTETGATYTILWAGEAIDRSDKSISKAAVSAVKYALIKTFLLTGGDDEDTDAASPEVEPKRTQVGGGKLVPLTVNASHDDDALWEPNEKPKSKEPASQAQIKRANSLGVKFYGTEGWEQKAAELAHGASKGDVNEIAQLKDIEIDVLMAGLDKRIKERAAQLQAAAA